MKKLFFIFSIIFMSATASFAAFHFELLGTYIGLGDMKNELGFGAGMGLGITDSLNFAARYIHAEKTTDPSTINETRYSYDSFLVGLEYVPTIPIFEKYQLSWHVTLLGGMGDASIDTNSGGGDEAGVAISFWTGPHFDLTQYVSFFMEFGYNYNIYSDKLKDASIQGFQTLVGARCTLYGSRDYKQGY